MQLLRSIFWQRLGLVLLMALGLGLAGCASEEAANESTRPWNSPEGWQNGSLPPNLIQPH
jgi:hypothetical protein